MLWKKYGHTVELRPCGIVVVDNHQVFVGDYRDALTKYNTVIAAFEREKLTVKALERVSAFWVNCVPVRLSTGEIVYA